MASYDIAHSSIMRESTISRVKYVIKKLVI